MKPNVKSFRRICAALLCAVFVFAAFTGCGAPKSLFEGEPSSPAPATAGPDGNPFASPTSLPYSGSYPFETGETATAEPDRSVRATLYYITDDGYILPVSTVIPWETGIAKACLNRLIATSENSSALKKLGLNAPIPNGTEIQLAISDGEARVNLQNMPALADYREEQDLFVSVINTLTQFPSIDTVTVFINGSAGKTANGSELPCSAGALALNVENGEVAVSGSAKAVTLYFPNGAGSQFIPVTRYMNAGGLYRAISALAEGTDLPGLRCCFPEHTLVLGAAIENGVLTVNLSKDFERITDTPGLYGLAMHTVLLTAQPFGSIDEVRFTVNGVPFAPDEN